MSIAVPSHSLRKGLLIKHGASLARQLALGFCSGLSQPPEVGSKGGLPCPLAIYEGSEDPNANPLRGLGSKCFES